MNVSSDDEKSKFICSNKQKGVSATRALPPSNNNNIKFELLYSTVILKLCRLLIQVQIIIQYSYTQICNEKILI